MSVAETILAFVAIVWFVVVPVAGHIITNSLDMADAARGRGA